MRIRILFGVCIISLCGSAFAAMPCEQFEACDSVQCRQEAMHQYSAGLLDEFAHWRNLWIDGQTSVTAAAALSIAMNDANNYYRHVRWEIPSLVDDIYALSCGQHTNAGSPQPN